MCSDARIGCGRFRVQGEIGGDQKDPSAFRSSAIVRAPNCVATGDCGTKVADDFSAMMESVPSRLS